MTSASVPTAASWGGDLSDGVSTLLTSTSMGVVLRTAWIGWRNRITICVRLRAGRDCVSRSFNDWAGQFLASSNFSNHPTHPTDPVEEVVQPISQIKDRDSVPA